ncbi:conserved hypothetical protein [Desulfamplus magnetovallimortis]|uniref:Uncharacterized protein n=1 Tax=Desulfamplus magnetovallimortis TaxID=1246637 RepID=A0A1W1HJI4_9BACT|nr:hypothetical protein [Desulfamplus magnetovallimortis]SLM32565.1 conserved hypothetical protein [Desulfamplus magnetovallimortis]
MEFTQTAKNRLLFDIDQLSSTYIIELDNFIQYLKFKQLNDSQLRNEPGKKCPESSFPLIDKEVGDETGCGHVISDRFLSEKFKMPPEQDPLLCAMGSVDVPPFSDIVDDIIYGER